MRARLSAVALVVVVLMALGAGVVAARGGFQMTEVFRFSDAPNFVDTGDAWLLRTDNGVTAMARIDDVQPGIYTLWWLVWNTPEGCDTAYACMEPDLFNTGTGLAIGYGGGASVGPNGVMHISAHLNEGTPLHGFPYPEFQAIGVQLEETTLVDSRHAEVHLVIRFHEQPPPDMRATALHSFNGACVYEGPIEGSDPIYGTPGPNTCVDTYFAVFPSEDAP